MPFTSTKQYVTDTVVRLQLAGEVRGPKVNQLGMSIIESIVMDFADEVVVDLDAVRALDTAGVCVLIWAHHAAVEWGSVYRVVNAHGQVHRALLATGMQGVLADSEDIGALLLALLALPPASIQD